MSDDLTPVEQAVYDQVAILAEGMAFIPPYMQRKYARIARRAVEMVRPLIETEVRGTVASELVASTTAAMTPLTEYRAQVRSGLLRDLAAELRANRARGDVSYVDSTWLEARAEEVERAARGQIVPDGSPAAQAIATALLPHLPYSATGLEQLAATVLDAARPLIEADALDDMADRIDRGPTFPLPPGVISELVRERAATLRAGQGGASHG